MAPLYVFWFVFFLVWDSTYPHSQSSEVSSTLKILITTGFISKLGEVACVIVLMLLLGEEEGGVVCSNLGGC